MEDSYQNLNRKLAEWAGFGFDAGRWYEPNTEHLPILQYYENFQYLPDFTQSLDACFKWLVPKLRSDENYVDINLRDFPPEMGDPYLFTIRTMTDHPVIKAWLAGGETPALALCKAIEKLIDAGKE